MHQNEHIIGPTTLSKSGQSVRLEQDRSYVRDRVLFEFEETRSMKIPPGKEPDERMLSSTDQKKSFLVAAAPGVEPGHWITTSILDITSLLQFNIKSSTGKLRN
ncbi:hypothetical protein TNCV_1145671 [Trichonephila clavipes]|nr:hypothetical protein TNCV_1145671 [Trichonephila clavipes]